MRLTIFGLLLLLVSCQPETPAEPVWPAGNWVNVKYLEALQQSKSPMQAQTAVDLSMLIIPGDTTQAVTAIWGFHEGAPFLAARAGDRYRISESGSQLSFDLLPAPDGQTLQAGEHRFQRLDSALLIDQIVPFFLFKGDYDLAGQPVSFTKNGRITGWSDFTQYAADFDFAAGVPNFDLITCWKNGISETEAGVPFHYQFAGDTLRIFETTCIQEDTLNGYCLEYQIGQTKYELVRKN